MGREVVIDVGKGDRYENVRKRTADLLSAVYSKVEEMTREGNVDFQNMASVSLKNFKVREI